MTVRFPDIPAPRAETRTVTDSWHGISRIDEYAWLRAENWQEVFRDPSLLDPAIRSHLEAENTYQAAMMANTEKLRKKLFREMRGRIKEDDSSVPMKDGPFAYGTPLPPAESSRASSARRATAARSASFSTATGKPRARAIFASAGPTTRPTTSFSCGASTTRDRSSTRSTSATSKAGPIRPTA
jgi:hypothetical protein